jgi:hypothetical protein
MTNTLNNAKQAAARLADEPVHLPDPERFRPEPGEHFQIRHGYQHDDTLFRVIEYAPLTTAPEKVQAVYRLPELPDEAVHCYRLERHGATWRGVSFHTFPTSIMVPEGSTAKAYSEANGGAAKPRARGPRQPGAGACEHCGEPTKGGRFVPGHDAKLKGELLREGTPGAEAERILRGWSHEAPSSAAASKLVKQGDGFLRSRVAARTGVTDKGNQGLTNS